MADQPTSVRLKLQSCSTNSPPSCPPSPAMTRKTQRRRRPSEARGGVGDAGGGATRWLAGSRVIVSSMMSRAIGAAAAAPALPCSTTTDSAYCGASSGANATNNACGRNSHGSLSDFETVLALLARDAADLRRAGLAGQLHVRSRQLGARRGAALLVHHCPHALRAPRSARAPAGRARASPRHATRCATPAMLRVRCGSTARPVAMRADIGRELQRRHLDEALADAGRRWCRRCSTAWPCASRHSRVGTRPMRCPAGRCPAVPIPRRWAIAAMRSMPVRRATS